MGGVETVVWGDVVQTFVILGGALIATIYLIWGTEGGLAGTIDLSEEAGKLAWLNFAYDFEQLVWLK